MSVVLVFIVGLIAATLWWLLRQGLMSKPWLETGPSPAMGPQPGPEPGIDAGRTGLIVFLAVVGCLFALFGSAFVMRMDGVALGTLSLPRVLWGNTVQLIVASLFLHRAAAAARRGDAQVLRRDLAVAALATVGFLLGQLIAWRDLTQAGSGLTAGPAASFFYMLTGLHGLHILGGLAALGMAATPRGPAARRLGVNLGLCAAYWDFLLIVWLGLLVLFLGWANRLVDICTGILT